MAITISGSVSEDKVSYAYLHCRPNGTPFYVGKGTEKRSKSTVARNRYYGFVTSKYGRDNILTGSLPCSSEKIAFDLEEGMIKYFKRMGVKLTNMTEGGDGGFRKGHIAWNKGKSGELSAETLKKMSDARKGTPSPNKGVACSEEVKDKISKANKGMAAWNKGRPHPEEVKNKLRIAVTGFKHTTEARARISAAQIGRIYEQVECPHCDKTGGSNVMSRWHFDNCKENT